MVDDYIRDLIDKNDDVSKIFHETLRATRQFRKEVVELDSSVGGLAVLKNLDPKKKIAAFSIGADPHLNNLETYAASLVENALEIADILDIEPIAMTNNFDTPAFDLEIARQAAHGFYAAAQTNQIAFVNGESAGLKGVINAPFNASGALIGLIDGSHPDGVFKQHSFHYSVFPHRGKPVFANCDGQGTKVLINQRTGRHTGIIDVFAMLADDAAKRAAEISYLSIVIDKSNNQVPAEEIRRIGSQLAEHLNVYFTLQEELLGDRIIGYGPAPYYLGGTCLSLIDEKTLANMPSPKVGDFLIAFRDSQNLNFRSNGITKLRQGLEEIFGPEYQNAEFQGENVGELAGQPSIILYPFFKEMLDQGLANGVYHMSGGSHRDKLAKPLAQAGLRAELGSLFEPHPLVQKLIDHFGMSWQDGYSIWPMNTDGFAAASPEKATQTLAYLKEKGFEARTVCSLENRALVLNLGKRGKVEYHV